MPLLKGIPTLKHMVTKRYSRPDNIFCTEGLKDLIVTCKVDPTIQPTSIDHFPMITKLLIPQERVKSLPSLNFREANWDIFKRELRTKLSTLPTETTITNIEQLNMVANHLTKAIQETIYQNIRKTKLKPDTKRWWNGDLNRLKKELHKLRANSYKF